MNKKLNWISVGISLATIHYGLGFLVGSGEAIYSEGSIGIIYAVSSALGILSLILISAFYRKKKYPIWELMGKSYGNKIKQMIASLSGVWMVGIIASQILGGSWALSLLGINHYISIALISLLILALAIVDLGKLSKIFFYMLLFSSFTLFAVLFDIGVEWIPRSVTDLSNSFVTLNLADWIGIVVTTVLVTFIGMDFHQFIVQSKSEADAKKGVILGFIILLILSMLLLSIINGSIITELVGNISDGKQVVPSLLMNFGNKINPNIGTLFLLPVIFVSIGSGSGVTRIVSKTLADLGINKKIKMDLRLVTILVAIVIALTGNSIISLIVSFYAIYVASIFIPFMLYLLDIHNKISISSSTIRNSIIGGLLGSLFVFVGGLVPGSPFKINQSAFIMVIGFTSSFMFYWFSTKLKFR